MFRETRESEEIQGKFSETREKFREARETHTKFRENPRIPRRVSRNSRKSIKDFVKPKKPKKSFGKPENPKKPKECFAKPEKPIQSFPKPTNHSKPKKSFAKPENPKEGFAKPKEIHKRFREAQETQETFRKTRKSQETQGKFREARETHIPYQKYVLNAFHSLSYTCPTSQCFAFCKPGKHTPHNLTLHCLRPHPDTREVDFLPGMINKSDKSAKMLSYANKIILAPMVRIGTLPMRLLALRYGADIVYTEELVDFKILKSIRMVNNVLNTVDFVDPSDGSVIFRTSPIEKDFLVIQIGTACPKRALKVAKMVEGDVSGIDINMGCPKEFSIKGGMGAALLSDPERAKSILKTLVENVSVPVTCKIRIFPRVEDTIKLVKEFEALGIAAIAIHGRTRDERPQHPVHPDAIRAVAREISIPVIANGGSREIARYGDIGKFREDCGASSVMIARAAEWNVSIFRRDFTLPLDEVITEYLKLCVDFDNSAHNTKYCVQNMLRELQETPRGKIFLESQTLEQICQIWDLGDYCRRKQLEYQQKGMFSRRECSSVLQEGPEVKKIKLDPDILERNVAFVRANYKHTNDLPKSILHLHANKSAAKLPTYETFREEKLFRSVISFQGKRYTSSFWEKNKKFAEQGAALVCLLDLGLTDEKTLLDNGSMLK